MSMIISKEQLDPKKPPRRIGRVKGVPVFEIFTKGGLSLVVMKNDGTGPKILGAAPHRALARHLAQIKEPEFFLEELSKSEEGNVDAFKHLVPHWSEVTDKINLRMDE